MNRQSQILILLGYILSISATLIINYSLNINPHVNPGNQPAFGVLGTIVLVFVMYMAGALCVAWGVKKYLREGKEKKERIKRNSDKWLKRIKLQKKGGIYMKKGKEIARKYVRKTLLEIIKDSKMQHDYYLRFKGGAQMLAADIYKFVLAPMGW